MPISFHEKRHSDGQTRTTFASTRRHIGFAVSPRGSGVGSACVAAPRRERGYDNGPGHHMGPRRPAVPSDVGSNDGGHDVSDRRAMILAFHSVQARTHQPDDAFVATWVFVAAYLLVWALSGIAAYAGVLAAAAVQPALVPATAAEIGGLILMVSGIYQLTPVKQRCLSECRRPIIMTSWHHSTAGALRMGLLHAVYCVGCCWLLFVILFPLGRTIEAMAAVTLVILGEKTLARPEFVSYGAAAVLVLCGLLMAVAPELPAVLRVFGSLTEDEGLGLGLILGITALFIAANAARPKR